MIFVFSKAALRSRQDVKYMPTNSSGCLNAGRATSFKPAPANQMDLESTPTPTTEVPFEHAYTTKQPYAFHDWDSGAEAQSAHVEETSHNNGLPAFLRDAPPELSANHNELLKDFQSDFHDEKAAPAKPCDNKDDYMSRVNHRHMPGYDGVSSRTLGMDTNRGLRPQMAAATVDQNTINYAVLNDAVVRQFEEQSKPYDPVEPASMPEWEGGTADLFVGGQKDTFPML